MCGSTSFGRFSAHHQERTTALGTSGFTFGAWRLERGGWSVAVGAWRLERGGWSVAIGAWPQTTTNNAPTVKPEAPSAVIRS
jgi:hypothetical protein